MPLKSPKNDRDIQSIHSAPKMRPTALRMAKNQGLDSVYQNKKIKIKNFARRQRRDVLAYTGTPHQPRRPVFVVLVRHQYGPFCDVSRTGRPTGRPTTTSGHRGPATGDRSPTDWRPVTGRPTGDTTDTADRLAARLAAVPVTSDTTSKGPATTSASGKDWPKGDNL